MLNNKIFNVFYGIFVVKLRSRQLITLHCMTWYIVQSCYIVPVTSRTVSTVTFKIDNEVSNEIAELFPLPILFPTKCVNQNLCVNLKIAMSKCKYLQDKISLNSLFSQTRNMLSSAIIQKSKKAIYFFLTVLKPSSFLCKIAQCTIYIRNYILELKNYLKVTRKVTK